MRGVGGIVVRMPQGRIPQSDIDAIRERTPIDEVVGEYVQLKPAGVDSLKGLSPFKEEKTPSFHVRPARGYYHCFSTGKGGDVFSFLMEMEQLSFPEAVEYCAEKIGYHINYQGGGTGRREQQGTRRRLLEANRAAHEFYQEQLGTREARTGREFLMEKGFGEEHARTFGIGYAPSGWDTLTNLLLKRGFAVKELEAAGLVTMGRRGPIDRFHRRLIWPIKSAAGEVIGFGARKLFDDDKLGKYMNTPETMLYHKSKVLFGLDQAKRHIAERHQAVIVEGYTDVMAMHAAGVTTAVAACGTAFGDEHLQVLRRFMLDDSYFRGELIYTFDGDEAGQNAAMRAFQGEQKFSGQSFVSVAPDGMDPCDVRLARGDAALRELVADRVPMFEFVVRSTIKQYDLGSSEGRLQALRRAVPIVAAVRDRSLRNQYARHLSGWVGWMQTDEVVEMVNQAVRQGAARQATRGPRERGRIARPDNATAEASAERSFPMPDPRDGRLWAQREALKLALQHPELAGQAFDQLPDGAFVHPAYRAVRDAVAAAGGCVHAGEERAVSWIAEVAGEMRQLAGRNLVSELAVEEVVAEEDRLERYVDSVFAALQEAMVGEEVARLKSRLERMQEAKDPEGFRTLFTDIMALESARRELKRRAVGG